MKYLIRSVKYLLALAVLYLAVLLLMTLTRTSMISPAETLSMLVHSSRGQLLIGALVLLAAIYPRFGFITRSTKGSLSANREQIVRAFEAEGFTLVREKSGEMIFRGANLFKRLGLLFEDEIRVTEQDDRIVLDGIRRGVARVVYRLGSYLSYAEDNEN